MSGTFSMSASRVAAFWTDVVDVWTFWGVGGRKMLNNTLTYFKIDCKSIQIHWSQFHVQNLIRLTKYLKILRKMYKQILFQLPRKSQIISILNPRECAISLYLMLFPISSLFLRVIKQLFLHLLCHFFLSFPTRS